MLYEEFLRGTDTSLPPKHLRENIASRNNYFNKFGNETHSNFHWERSRVSWQWMSPLPKSEGQNPPAPVAERSSIQHTCHPQCLPTELHPLNFSFWLLGIPPEGCSWRLYLLEDAEYVTQTGLPMILQVRACKCFRDYLVWSFKWCGEAVDCWETAAAVRPVQQEVIRIGAAHSEKRNLSNSGRGNFTNSGRLCSRRVIPSNQRWALCDFKREGPKLIFSNPPITGPSSTSANNWKIKNYTENICSRFWIHSKGLRGGLKLEASQKETLLVSPTTPRAPAKYPPVLMLAPQINQVFSNGPLWAQHSASP